QPGTNRCRHGFFDQIDLTCASAQGRFANCTTFYLSGATRNTHNNAWAGSKHTAWMHHAYELLEHLLGNGEVGDDAVFHGADGLDVAGNTAKHFLGLLADGLDDL